MNSKEKEALEYFGKAFMEQVRDNGIYITNWLIEGKNIAPSKQVLQNEISTFTNEQKDIIKQIILEAVDQTLHHTLFMLEQEEEIKLIVGDINLNEASDGLAGELYTEDGWIEKFSKEEKRRN